MTTDRTQDPGSRWMTAWQAGDEAAFDRLVEHYSGAVYALATRFLGPVGTREDLVQETFLRVLRARARYRPTARFSTFLYRIVFNLCVNERERRSGNEASLQAVEQSGDGTRREWEDETAPTPFERLEREDLAETVQRAIAALPERQRMALLLARYEELSFREIADVLDSSERAVKSLVHRARENLRELLASVLKEETT